MSTPVLPPRSLLPSPPSQRLSPPNQKLPLSPPEPRPASPPWPPSLAGPLAQYLWPLVARKAFTTALSAQGPSKPPAQAAKPPQLHPAAPPTSVVQALPLALLLPAAPAARRPRNHPLEWSSLLLALVSPALSLLSFCKKNNRPCQNDIKKEKLHH